MGRFLPGARARQARGAAALLLIVLSGVVLPSSAAARTATPVFARSVAVHAVSGSVFITAPGGGRTRVHGTLVVPVGSTLDVRKGTAAVASRLRGGGQAHATVAGTPVAVTQSRAGAGVTTLTLADESFPDCTVAGASRRIPRRRYHLRAITSKDFVIAGVSGSAQAMSASAGWATTDTCGGTNIMDSTGKITSRFGDVPTQRTLAAGESTSGVCNASDPISSHFCTVATFDKGPPAETTPPRLSFELVLRTSQRNYRLCITDPHGDTTCTTYPLSSLNTTSGPAQVGQVSCGVYAGPGNYVARWQVGTRVLSPEVSIHAQTGGSGQCQFTPLGTFGESIGVVPGSSQVPGSGGVSIQTPGGAMTPLTTSAIVPSGTLIDASQGPVSLITVLPNQTTALASLSGAVFEVIQDPSEQGLTTIDLDDASLAVCTPGKGTLFPVRETAVIAGPEFRINGRFVSATPTSDADFGLIDQCNATELIGTSGSVEVRDAYQQFPLSGSGSAEVSCTAADATPSVCAGWDVDPATASARYLLALATTAGTYQLCANGCGTFNLAGTTSVRTDEVVCSATADGAQHSAVWATADSSVIEGFGAPVDPTLPSSSCVDEGAAAATGP